MKMLPWNRIIHNIKNLPAPKFMVRMVYRSVARDCDKLARSLSAFGQIDEADILREWAVAYRKTADELKATVEASPLEDCGDD